MYEIKMKRLLIVLATVSTAACAQTEYYVHPETKTIRALQKDIAEGKAKRNQILEQSGMNSEDVRLAIADRDTALEESAHDKEEKIRNQHARALAKHLQAIIQRVKNDDPRVTRSELLEVAYYYNSKDIPADHPDKDNMKILQNVEVAQMISTPDAINWYKEYCIKNDEFVVYGHKTIPPGGFCIKEVESKSKDQEQK